MRLMLMLMAMLMMLMLMLVILMMLLLMMIEGWVGGIGASGRSSFPAGFVSYPQLQQKNEDKVELDHWIEFVFVDADADA